MRSDSHLLFIAALSGIILILLLDRSCNSSPDDDTQTVTTVTRIKGDPYPVQVPVRVPEPYQVEIPQVVHVPADADTAEIIRSFYSRMAYSDTLKNDTSMLAVVNDTVYNNRITSREFIFQNRRETAIITQTTVQHKQKEAFLKVYPGIMAQISPQWNGFGIGPSATATLRPGALLAYAYDVRNNAHIINLGWKLHLFASLKKKR
jgi:hypothetical protein